MAQALRRLYAQTLSGGESRFQTAVSEERTQSHVEAQQAGLIDRVPLSHPKFLDLQALGLQALDIALSRMYSSCCCC
jgi:hypothetical protein